MKPLIAKIVDGTGRTLFVNYIAKCINKRAEIEPLMIKSTNYKIVPIKRTKNIKFIDKLC